GFSTANPWLKVNPNYPRINVARQRAEPDSVLAFYRKLIGLRRTEPALAYGRYEPLLARHRQVFAYVRRLGDARIMIVVNLSGRTARCRFTGGAPEYDGLLLANRVVAPHPARAGMSLAAYEARVYRVG
nr:DUF3459 domain-containing protein [Zoogloeaceae bacterium]